MTLRLAERLAGRQQLLAIIVALLDFVCLFVVAAWVHTSWKGIPESHRGTISPRRAWLSLFIPLYGLYWGFAVNLALCDTLNAILEHARSPRRAPRLLGLFATAFWYLAPVTAVFFPWSLRNGALRWLPEALGLLDCGLWFAYMLQCDEARHAVARIAESGEVLPATRPSYVQRSAGPSGPVLAFCTLLFAVLIAWGVTRHG
jgi:hypothetical protein